MKWYMKGGGAPGQTGPKRGQTFPAD